MQLIVWSGVFLRGAGCVAIHFAVADGLFWRTCVKSRSGVLREASLVAAFALPAVFGSTRLFADVTGKVMLEGTAPEMKVIDMSATKECAALHPDPVTEETVIVGEKGELKNVVVSLKKDEDKEMPGAVPQNPAVLDQKACMYEPHVLAMMVGQPLIVKTATRFCTMSTARQRPMTCSMSECRTSIRGTKLILSPKHLRPSA